jgi:hypothetical protein
MSEKYVVFKVDDWDKFVKFLRHEDRTGFICSELPESLADAEVFRHQDLVSAPIFYAASSIYQSYLELVEPNLSPERKEDMHVVVDHFFEAAEKATGLPNRKLPD